MFKLVNIKASLNTELSDMAKQSFSNTVPVIRPSVKDAIIMVIKGLIGFVEAEGCFQVIVQEPEGKSVSVSLRFTLTHHFRVKQLIESLINYLSCGRHYTSLNRNPVCFLLLLFMITMIRLFLYLPNILYSALNNKII